MELGTGLVSIVETKNGGEAEKRDEAYVKLDENCMNGQGQPGTRIEDGREACRNFGGLVGASVAVYEDV